MLRVESVNGGFKRVVGQGSISEIADDILLAIEDVYRRLAQTSPDAAYYFRNYITDAITIPSDSSLWNCSTQLQNGCFVQVPNPNYDK